MEAIYVLLKRGPAPPPVYQGQYDPKALFNALKVLPVIRANACEYWHFPVPIRAMFTV